MLVRPAREEKHLSGNCSGGDHFCDMAKKGLSRQKVESLFLFVFEI